MCLSKFLLRILTLERTGRCRRWCVPRMFSCLGYGCPLADIGSHMHCIGTFGDAFAQYLPGDCPADSLQHQDLHTTHKYSLLASCDTRASSNLAAVALSKLTTTIPELYIQSCMITCSCSIKNMYVCNKQLMNIYIHTCICICICIYM